MKQRMTDAAVRAPSAARAAGKTLAALCLFAVATAHGQEAATSAKHAARASEVGHATRAWLDLQRENTAAAPALPTLGAEASLAYERYMDSFKTRIPATFASPIEAKDILFSNYKNGGGSSQTPSN